MSARKVSEVHCKPLSSAKLTGCRACGETGLDSMGRLGLRSLNRQASQESESGNPADLWPLELVRCSQCALLQTAETLSAAWLFRHSVYVAADSDSLVMEIEPAQDRHEIACYRGMPAHAGDFGQSVALRLAEEGIRADVIHANNALSQVADPNGMAAAIKLLLARQGVANFLMSYLKPLTSASEMDKFSHEQLCYFSLTSLKHLLDRHQLKIFDVEQPTHQAGLLQLQVGHEGARAAQPAVDRLLKEESQWVHRAFSLVPYPEPRVA